MTKLFETPADLGEFLFRITDNGGRTADRYTVIFSDGDYLGLSGSPSHPQGFSQWGEGIDLDGQAQRIKDGEEVDLALGDLPPHIVSHIIGRLNEGMADFLEMVEARHEKAVAASRVEAEEHDGTSSSLGKGIYLAGDVFMVKREGLPEEDMGPYSTAREAVLATLPDHHGLSGPEYHSPLDVASLEPSADVAKALAELEAKVEAEFSASSPNI